MPHKTIKSVKDFPDWFFEKDYDIPDTTIRWAGELNVRVFLSLFLKSNKRKDSEDHLNWFLNCKNGNFISQGLFASNVGESISDLSIFDAIILSSFIWKSDYENIIDEVKAALKTTEEFYSESDNTPLKALIRSRYFDEIAGDYIMDSFDSDENFTVFEDSAYEKYLKYSPYFIDGPLLSGIPITVNLACDDKTLLETFSKWLKEKRQVENIKSRRPFTESDYGDWKKYKILEVFDLDMWAEFFNYKITDAAMAKALWPDGDLNAEDISPIDRLRKTTRGKIQKIINPLMVKKIYSQIAQEYNEEEEYDEEE